MLDSALMQLRILTKLFGRHHESAPEHNVKFVHPGKLRRSFYFFSSCIDEILNFCFLATLYNSRFNMLSFTFAADVFRVIKQRQ